MQKQAAPARFKGNYPHSISINKNMLPNDKFLLKSINTNIYNNEITTTINGDLTGYFPKLSIVIYDSEIKKLAGPNLENFDSIDCKDITCTCDNKDRYLQLFNSNVSDKDSILYNNCKRTIFAAAKRQIKSAPTPSLEVLNDFINWSKQTIDNLIGDDLSNFGYSFNQWINHLTKSKQDRMFKIKEFIEGNDPLLEHYIDLQHTDPKMFHYEAICKVEVQSIDGKPRMVCAIPDLIKYIMGPVCWKLEELFSQKIPTYCGGQNLTQMQDKINHYIDDGFCIVAEGDGSAFDNTQDVLLKSLDRYIYNKILDKIYHVPKELFQYVSQSLYKTMDVILNVDKHRKTLMTYSVLGTVFSGDCDTTLMNTLRMGFYNWYTNYKMGLKLNEDFVCFSKGDDFTVMYKNYISINEISKGYKRYWLGKPESDFDDRNYGLGQILKFIEFGYPNSIKFCSLRAWYTSNNSMHIYLTRNPDKFMTLAKYSRKALHLSAERLSEYYNDQAIALLSSYKGIKYFEDMAHLYQKYAHIIRNERGLVRLFNNSKLNRKGDKRQTLFIEAQDLFDGYNYQPRDTFVKIIGNYWDTMKYIETKQETILSGEELSLVNFQINTEYADRPILLLDTGLPH
jgi:hypothetical protein